MYLAGSMTMTLFAGCIGNGGCSAGRKKMRAQIQKNRQHPKRHRR